MKYNENIKSQKENVEMSKIKYPSGQNFQCITQNTVQFKLNPKVDNNCAYQKRKIFREVKTAVNSEIEKIKTCAQKLM